MTYFNVATLLGNSNISTTKKINKVHKHIGRYEKIMDKGLKSTNNRKKNMSLLIP
jgi:hypothetical protein